MIRFALSVPVLFLVALASVACSVTDQEITLTGDWCTMGALGSDNQPITEMGWVGGQLFQQGAEVTGTGSVKRADEDRIWSSRFQGNVTGDQLLLNVTPIGQGAEGAPVFEMALEIQGRNDLAGSVMGESGLPDEISLVRLGARCFQ